MADIELVIKIDEKDYDDILNGETKASALNYSTFNAIRNGTPIPKGHGRLIYAKDVGEYLTLADVPTIIEVDKAESEETK